MSLIRNKNVDVVEKYFNENERKKEAEKYLKETKPVILDKIEKGEELNPKFEVKRTERETTSLNDNKLMEILESKGLGEGIIKTRKYVDMEALEDALYNEEIDPKLLEPAQEVRKSIALTVKKKKVAK